MDVAATITPSTSPLAGEPLVRIRGLRKRFGGSIALAGIDLDVQRSSVLALLGQNGAGKSTMIKILAGVYKADAGEVTVAGQPLGSGAATRSMSFIHQDLGLVEWMTVAENIALGTGYSTRGGLISWRLARGRCAEALSLVADTLDPESRIADLSRAERSLVAIARALSTDAELIVLDEPTASLPASDCARLFSVLHKLRDRGHGIIYVSHRLDEIYRVADRVAVLRDGRLVNAGPLDDYPPVSLVRDIVGHEPVAYHSEDGMARGPVILRLDATCAGEVGPVDLELHAGEVVGMVGLNGAGHMELGRALIGAAALDGGQVVLDGASYQPTSTTEAVARGMGFVTSNRLEEGCAAELTVRENFLANPRARDVSAISWRRPRRERSLAAELIQRFAVRPLDSEAPIATLSGGNQQKVMIGRWLSIQRRVVVLEEPTAGVDVGAKAEIYTLLDTALRGGLAVLLISTDFEEVVNVCHRALVFVRGHVTSELSGHNLTITELTRQASAAPELSELVPA